MEGDDQGVSFAAETGSPAHDEIPVGHFPAEVTDSAYQVSIYCSRPNSY